MKVRVQYTAQLRTALGLGEEEVELPDGSTLAALLDHLARGHGDVAALHLLDRNGQALKSLMVVVNDSVQASRDAATAVLRAGDVVVLLPPIAGG